MIPKQVVFYSAYVGQNAAHCFDSFGVLYINICFYMRQNIFSFKYMINVYLFIYLCIYNLNSCEYICIYLFMLLIKPYN